MRGFTHTEKEDPGDESRRAGAGMPSSWISIDGLPHHFVGGKQVV